MNVSLVLHKKNGSKKVLPIRSKATILGRRPDCDFCIPLQVVSRRHCQISQETEALKVRDLKSSNGTFVNGKKILGETQAKPGDKIQIGPLTFVVQVDGEPAEPSPDDTAVMMPDLSKVDPDELNGSATFIGTDGKK
ncbi:MAG: FHA domain-containing protein [Phycisphaerales bacterium]